MANVKTFGVLSTTCYINILNRKLPQWLTHRGQFVRSKANVLIENTKPGIVVSPIHTVNDAQKFVSTLDGLSKEYLYKELQRVQTTEDTGLKAKEVVVPGNLLRQAFFFHGLPFIAFGFCDNLIMILAGDYIDVKFGVMFGISTMAAAALGNIVSDVIGIGVSGYTEKFTSFLGASPPLLTVAQALHWKTRYTIALGRSIGITIGCLIGMFPLLFLVSNHGKDRDKKD